jgi:peptidoglycan/LPS O-acetylase OafA/YrhL
MTAPPSKLQSVQAARGIAALLVVMHHISLRFEQRVDETNFLGIFDRFGFAGVDLFFVISGLIMVVTCHHQFGRGAAMLPFLWRRATRIYPLYWIFTLVQLSVIVMIPSVTDRIITTGSIIASFLLLPQSVYPILAPGWTLVYEMFFYLVFSVLFFIPKRFSAYFLVVWGTMTIGLYMLQMPEGLSNTTDLLQLPLYASPMTLEFLAGCLVGYLYVHQVKRFAAISLALGTIWFLGGWVLVEALTDASAEFGLTRVIVFGTSSAMILYGSITLQRIDFNRWLVAIGDASYSLYLSHLLVIGAFAIIWSRVHLQGIVIQALFEAVMLVACVGFAFFTYRTIELPMLNRMRRKKTTDESTLIAVQTTVADT